MRGGWNQDTYFPLLLWRLPRTRRSSLDVTLTAGDPLAGHNVRQLVWRYTLVWDKPRG